MIFDGYDELTYQQRRVNFIFLDVIRGEVLPDCAVLVTSRPYASNYLHQLESINRHVEVLGFKEEQIYPCVEKCLPDSASAKALIQQLEEREDILSLCYIPLNCMIMVHVYKQKKTLSTTMTELMHQFIIDTVTRGVKYIKFVIFVALYKGRYSDQALARTKQSNGDLDKNVLLRLNAWHTRLRYRHT